MEEKKYLSESDVKTLIGYARLNANMSIISLLETRLNEKDE